jgi:hypothetical protein
VPERARIRLTLCDQTALHHAAALGDAGVAWCLLGVAAFEPAVLEQVMRARNCCNPTTSTHLNTP